MLRSRNSALQRGRLRQLIARAFVAAMVPVLVGGCADRSKPSARDYLPASNDVVTAYGMTLDENASPEQVVWVLLSAIREDVQTKVNTQDWQELMKLQCRLANIELLRGRGDTSARIKNVDSDALLFSIVSGWAPALNCYTEHFDDDFEAARARMISQPKSDTRLPAQYQSIHVVNYVLPAAELDGAACGNGGVNIQLALSRTQNGYWRLYEISLGPPPAPAS